MVTTNTEQEKTLEINIYLNHLGGFPQKTITKRKHDSEAKI